MVSVLVQFSIHKQAYKPKDTRVVFGLYTVISQLYIRNKKPMIRKSSLTKSNKILFISLAAGLLGFLAKVSYRPWIIKTQTNDFKIHAFSPSFFCALGICLFIAYWAKKNYIKAMSFGALGAVVYEVEQIWTTRTFDPLDVIATICGFGLAVLIVKGVNRHELTTASS